MRVNGKPVTKLRSEDGLDLTLIEVCGVAMLEVRYVDKDDKRITLLLPPSQYGAAFPEEES